MTTGWIFGIKSLLCENSIDQSILKLHYVDTFNMPTSSIVGVGKRRILTGPWGPAKAALVRNYLEIYWPRAGGLSAVNAIGTQLRDPINSRLTRWRMAAINVYMDAAAELGGNPVSKHQIQPEYGDEQADAGRDCRTRLARPNSQARTRTGKYSFSLFS